MKSVYCDFEFSEVTEEKVKLVCAVTTHDGQTLQWWLHNDPKEQNLLKKYLQKFDLIISYAAIAEARSLYSLGMDPLQKKWIDLFLEYRCLTNHNDELVYGQQLVDGKIKVVYKPKPKWERTEEDSSTGFKPTHSLAECTFKLLGKIIDTEHKTAMRNLIISNPPEYTEEQQKAILEYCQSDVKDLEPLWEEMIKWYKKLDITLTDEKILEYALTRGRFSAITAIMESRGYPIDVKKTKNFSNHVGNILFDMQREINELFPDIEPFRWNKKEQRYSMRQKEIKEWIKKQSKHIFENWQSTDKGDISLSLEAWSQHFNYTHDYPKDNFGAQMVRYLKLKQSIYGFSISSESEKKTFWDYVGSDGRVRPYTNPYGAQSSRSQQSATGFMFLKPAWMRALVVPPKGKAMAGVDYSSQEFFISALLSNDQNMIDSYLSGDPYFAFAKLAGAVPKDADKKDYKEIRDLFKSTVLGISYLMAKYGLASKLTADTGKLWTPDEAQVQIDLWKEAYPDLDAYQKEIIAEYQEGSGRIYLPCGWAMWHGNENYRSVANMPIQGHGASVLRLAVDLAFRAGIYCSKTLHDAIYIEYDIGDEEQISTLMDCMREAFVHYAPSNRKKEATQIRLDPFAWGPSYERDSEITLKNGIKVPTSDIYIDERSIKDYEMFSKYFEDDLSDLL